MARSSRPTAADEEAGAIEPFEDAPLYDFEYRRRRADVRFYRQLAGDHRAFGGGPILDLACGTGRMLVPLLRDGHTVVGVDRSTAMLARAAARVERLSAARRRHALIVRGDLRALPARGRFGLIVCAFHSIQHLVEDADLLRLLRSIRRCLAPHGWLAFDVLPPDPLWIRRDSARRWGRTQFRHPVTGERLVYTNTHQYDERRRALHIRLYYQPVDERGAATGAEREVKLCHRQLTPREVNRLLAKSGLELLATFGGFDGRPLDDADADEHIYVARPARAHRR